MSNASPLSSQVIIKSLNKKVLDQVKGNSFMENYVKLQWTIF